MSSYCEINKFIEDKNNHPHFIKRADKYDNNCSPVDKDAKLLSEQDCLTMDEAACYSSYKLGKMRETVESKLNEIHQPENAKTAAFDSIYQTTMITGVVWAALGTTMLYYVFTKI